MKKLLVLVAVLVLVLSLVPCAHRTAKWASDAYGLVNLATLDAGAMSYNPYDEDGYFLNQDMAAWMLENFEYPYRRCSGLSRSIGLCGMPLVTWAGRNLDGKGAQTQERGYALLAYFLARKEPVNARFKGMAPIHEAVLFANARYLAMLLSAGADPRMRIDKPGAEYDGFDALEFLDYLQSKGKGDFTSIRALLAELNSRPGSLRDGRDCANPAGAPCRG